jgi:hypothetical protein
MEWLMEFIGNYSFHNLLCSGNNRLDVDRISTHVKRYLLSRNAHNFKRRVAWVIYSDNIDRDGFHLPNVGLIFCDDRTKRVYDVDRWNHLNRTAVHTIGSFRMVRNKLYGFTFHSSSILAIMKPVKEEERIALLRAPTADETHGKWSTNSLKKEDKKCNSWTIVASD